MNTCEAVLRTASEWGISVFFGIPGHHNLPLYEALQKLDVRQVTVRHEQSAAFMADGYARCSGEIAGCLLIDGPGFLNASTGIAQAYSDSVPMLVVTPCVRPNRMGMLHELPGQASISREICRAHTRLSADTVSSVGQFLTDNFVGVRPGPVHIEIPLLIMNDSVIPSDTQEAIDEGSPDPFSNERLQQAVQSIKTSTSPLIIAGGGVVNAQRELCKFAELIDAPVINTTNAKGILPPSHPLHVGSSPSLPEVRAFIAEADVVVAVGTELGETDFDFFFLGEELPIKFLIRIDIDKFQIHSNRHADVGIVGDSKEVLGILSDRLGLNPREESGAVRVEQLRNQTVQSTHYHDGMLQLLNCVRDHTDVLVGDSAQPNYYAHWLYEPNKPRGYFHSATGFGTLGYAIPAAIGAKIARGSSRVSCLIGDGGANFTLTEMLTAQQLGLVIPFLVWNNEAFEEIDKAVDAISVKRFFRSPQAPDYQLLANSFRMKYAQPTNVSELGHALERAYATSGPTIIELKQHDFVDPNTLLNWYSE